jgi:hypothetical protein
MKKVPPALDRIVDIVLAYHPKPNPKTKKKVKKIKKTKGS